MNLHYLFALLLIPANSGVPETGPCEPIPWSNEYKLGWQDFQGSPDMQSKFNAVSVQTISYRYHGIRDTLWVENSCEFQPCQSWTRSSTTTLLNHEQTHFNIAELYRRKFVFEVTHSTFSQRLVDSDLDRIYKNICQRRSACDSLYDLQTRRSLDREAQVSWDARIADSLKVYRNYQSKLITITGVE